MNVSIGKYIYSALTAITGLKVFPVVADFNEPTPTTPFAVYQRTSMEPDYTKGLFSGQIRHDYSVTVADNDYTNTVTTTEAVINKMLALTGKTMTDIYFNQVRLTDLSEDFIDGLYTQTIQFEINTTRK